MTDEVVKHVRVSETDDGRWRVTVFDDNGKFEHEHIIDEQPTTESVKALIADANLHREALERLVYR